MDKVKTGNKGEWGEIYGFTYLLVKLEVPYEAKLFTIPQIMKWDEEQYKTYRCEGDFIITMSNQSIPISLLHPLVIDGFKEIKNGKGRSFNCPSLDRAMDLLGLKKIRASKDKIDFIINIDNQQCACTVKSMIGGSPSLINATNQTNIYYRIKNVDSVIEEELKNNPEKRKPKDLVRKIYSNGGFLEFIKYESENYPKCMGSDMAQFLSSYMIPQYYQSIGGSISEIVEVLFKNKKQVGGFSIHQTKNNIKSYLEKSATYLNPSQDREKNSTGAAQGGLVTIRENGTVDLKIFHPYSNFGDHLYNTCFFDTGSTKRHDFAYPYKNKVTGNYEIKLNINIKMSTK
jgi:hypothetical protein